jgi:hypothetical protein
VKGDYTDAIEAIPQRPARRRDAAAAAAACCYYHMKIMMPVMIAAQAATAFNLSPPSPHSSSESRPGVRLQLTVAGAPAAHRDSDRSGGHSSADRTVTI